MKRCFLCFVFFQLCFVGYSQTGAIHCLGNGDYCVYEKGCNISQVFGPPYSSPSMFSSELDSGNIQVKTVRLPGSAIYVHSLFRKGEEIGSITDFVDSRFPCFCRITDLKESVTFSLRTGDVGNWQKNMVSTTDYSIYGKSLGYNQGILVSALPGLFVYNTYPCPFEINHLVLTKGNVQLISKEGGEGKDYLLSFLKGKGVFYLIGGPSFDMLNQSLQKTLIFAPDSMLSQTRNDWRNFTGKRINFDSILSKNNPCRSELLKSIDDVSVLLKTQQGKDGGVLAGHFYHMAYVRDEYGVSRALLTLGYFEEAKKILDFYDRIWKRYGVIHNAQAIGVPGIFHRHENDEVEITGYVLIQAFDYLKRPMISHLLID